VKRNAYRILVGEPLGRPRHMWVNNNKRMGWYGLDLAEDRDQWRALVSTVMNLWVP
jgi:hypothetical protein